MREAELEGVVVTPGEVLGKASDFIAGRGAYVASDNTTVYASLTGFRSVVPPSSDSPDQRPVVEVTCHKAHGVVPVPGSIVIARVTKVMARMAMADIMCVGPKSVKEKFTGIIRTACDTGKTRGGGNGLSCLPFGIVKLWDISEDGWRTHKQQDVRATEIDKVDIYLSFHHGDIVKALVLSLGDARAYFLSTAKNELGVVSAESGAGAKMVPISWTEMQCPLTGKVEQRKVAKVGE